MSGIQHLREKFGLTQQQLAVYLGVARSHLAMAEKATRSLPTSALLKLAVLEKSLHSKIPYPTPQLQELQHADAARIGRYVKKCMVMIAEQKNKLAALETNYQQCQQVMLAIGCLHRQLPPGDAGKKERLWLELLEKQTLEKIKTCSYAGQVILQLRISALEQEVAQAARMLF